VWSFFAENMSNGVSRWGNQGLDFDHSWGAVYWGGALFWLIADVEIHRATDNRCSVGDALSEIVKQGGINANEWDFEQALSVGDSVLGSPILDQLYAHLGRKAHTIDLRALFARLGVEGKDGLQLDDTAPFSAIRRALMTKAKNHGPCLGSKDFEPLTWMR
jgi:hypothetical protein